MLDPDCPTCQALHGLLHEAELDVVRCAIEAREKGPSYGVFVGVPEELGAETPEEAAALAIAREVGYYAGVATVDELLRHVPEDGHDPDLLDEIRRRLCLPPPEGQVHVLVSLDGCVATITAHADPRILAQREREMRRVLRIGDLFERAEPVVLARAEAEAQRPRTVFIVTSPDDPALDKLPRVAEPDRAAARERGVYVALHDAADAIAALPLEGLEAEDALRATKRLLEPIPEGFVRAIAVYDGHMTTITRRAEPGCLDIGC